MHKEKSAFPESSGIRARSDYIISAHTAEVNQYTTISQELEHLQGWGLHITQHALTILISKISTVIDPLFPRKGVQQSGVELIHIHIVRTENGPLQKVLVQVARMHVWINLSNHLREVMAT